MSCDSGDIRLLGQAKKIAWRMLLPHHACPLPYLKNKGYAAWEGIKEVSDTTGNLKEWRQSYLLLNASELGLDDL